MNIHLITYLTSKLFWIYTVFRYNTILYPKNEDTQKLFLWIMLFVGQQLQMKGDYRFRCIMEKES